MIKHVNKLMSKCRKLSRRWKKLKKRLQKWYNKRTNKLKDYIEKLTYNLVKEYDTIVFEENYATIKILIGGEQNMVFPLSQFIERLKNKFEWYKPTAEGVVFVDAKNTSKTCHHCGHINKELDVKTRKWICPKCGEELDRDVNASINILNRWNPGDSLENTQ
ncbi:MAG: transposase [Methanobrevibacter sp.]|nr:transposase [Methanobrevibacter sp.]